LAWPLRNPFASPFVPFITLLVPFVPTPFLIVFPTSEGAIVAGCPWGGTK